MLFNSFHFAIFLPIVFLLYWLFPAKYRWTILLLSSCYFYMSWNVKYIFLIFLTTAITYVCALLIEKHCAHRKAYLILSLVVCFGTLFFYKYFNFASESMAKALRAIAIPVHPVTLQVMLPVGISFYTFQTLSYVIDVYRGDVPAERHFGHYAAFITFFPQLVAGPIERTRSLLPQIKAEHRFDGDSAIYGLKLMMWGFFKKIVIADDIAIYVDRVYNNLSYYKGFALVLATVLFTFQIYCDFSGYSDIARGTAKLFGIDLMQNFKSPYFSASIKEFWSRWHISLSTWFRDYVYIPLGGNRVGKLRHYWNLLVTFLVSGLWHGANWTFVLWGGVHGVAQIVENALGIRQSKKQNIAWLLRVFVVFCFAALAWVFFRVQSIAEAAYVFRHMLDGVSSPIHYIVQGFTDINMAKTHLAFSLVCYFAPLCVLDYFGAKTNGDAITVIEGWRTGMRWLFYIVLGLGIVLFSQKGVAAEFVYFQF